MWLIIAALEERYEACADATSSRHFQTIWLLAKGHTIGEVSAMTSFGRRWIEQLLERYNAFGPSALGDLRRRNGAAATVLRPEVLDRLRARLVDPPPDGGVWTSAKVARWMAGELGLASLAPQRGWEALRAIDWSIQKPRPRNPKAATPAEQDAFKNIWPAPFATYGPPRSQWVCRGWRLISLLQRIRPRRTRSSCQDGDTRVPVLIN